MSDGELSRLEVLRDLDRKRLTTQAAVQLLGLEDAFAWKEERRLSQVLILQYDKVMFNEEAGRTESGEGEDFGRAWDVLSRNRYGKSGVGQHTGGRPGNWHRIGPTVWQPTRMEARKD